tara:strand:+ start:1088 stop:1885 length:798 start_codon:yes stop_codon:yes gene_type:complete
MARIDQGNNLASVILQPGAKFQEDGYGLTTGTCTFKAANTASVGSTINRGSACPIAAYSYCKAHKFSVTFDALGIAVYVVDYVGMNASSYPVYTDRQMGVSQGLTSESITTHSNFFTASTGIAGATPFTASTIDPTEFKGLNGAHFQKATGGKFLGFKDPASPLYYGKTNYLAPQTSFSGHFYTTSSTAPKNFVAVVGKTSGTGDFYGLDLLPSYMGTAFVTATGSRNQLLLAQVNVEDFGSLYKVNYEIRYNRDGYVAAVYPAA